MTAAWRPLFLDIDATALEAREPRLIRGQHLRIDLKAPGLSFLVDPSNGARPVECNSTAWGRHNMRSPNA
jgi:hypothetical protein